MGRLKLSLTCLIALLGLYPRFFAPAAQGFFQEPPDVLKERVKAVHQEGRDLFFQGSFAAARLKFQEASRLNRQLSGSSSSLALKYEALCYQYEDELDKALLLFQEALRIDRRENSHVLNTVADALNNIGWVFYLKGDYAEASKYLKEAAAAAQDPDALIVPVWYKGRIQSNLGAVYLAMGDYSTAFKYLRHVLDQSRNYHDKMSQTRTLQHLGNLERLWGNWPEALNLYEEAVRVGHQAYDQPYNRAYLVEVLNDLGVLQVQLQQAKQARAVFDEALAISRQLGTRRLLARSLSNLGNLLRDQGNITEALNAHLEAWRLSQEAELMPMMALALIELGFDHIKSADYEQAMTCFRQALETGGRSLTPELQARLYTGLAEAVDRLGNGQKALEHYHRAIESMDEVRLEVLTEDRKLGYWQARQATFERAVTLTHLLHQKNPQAGYAARAFAYAERARARAFLDMLAEARVHIQQGLSLETRREERAIFQEMTRINQAFLRERLSPEARARLDDAYLRTQARLQEFRQRIRLTDPAYAELKYPEPLDLEKLRKSLPDQRTLVLEFLLGERQSFLWAVSAQDCRMVALPARGKIQPQVKRFYRTLVRAPENTASFDNYNRQALRLYTLLLKPIEKMLAEYEHIVVIPDGELHYVPFEALVTRRVTQATARSPLLLLSHRISYAPSASILSLLATIPATGKPASRQELLAYGDPVFARRPRSAGAGDAVRAMPAPYGERSLNLAPLPHTRREINEIAAQYPPHTRKVVLGPAAKESGFKRESLDRYRYLHLATHAIADEQIAARSGVIFSLVGDREEDGILQMTEIMNLRLNADLVVLSACRTGLGQLARGEGMIGMTRAFLYAGSPSVVVSLWNVQDDSTADLMKRFYRHLRTGRSKAEALRMAKLNLIRSDIPAYRHPYYWAAFVLVGRG